MFTPLQVSKPRICWWIHPLFMLKTLKCISPSLDFQLPAWHLCLDIWSAATVVMCKSKFLIPITTLPLPVFLILVNGYSIFSIPYTNKIEVLLGSFGLRPHIKSSRKSWGEYPQNIIKVWPFFTTSTVTVLIYTTILCHMDFKNSLIGPCFCDFFL